MNLTDLVTGGVGSKAIETISKITGVSESKAKWIVAAAVPLMIAALNYNAKNKGQAENIDKAIDQHSNSGILDKIGDFFGQGGAEQGGEQNVSEDGNKIVNHMFGQNTEVVTQHIADKAGLSSSQVTGVLATLAPIVMGYLGQQKQASSGGGIGDLIGSVLGGGTQQNAGGGMLGGILGSFLGGSQEEQAQATEQPASGGSVTDMLGGLAGSFFDKSNDGQAKGNILDSIAGMFGK
ncbi:DUF937 domain-containing protein [Sphingobacterium siyangense]|uniref:DUF937 domain-containing protein n=1 Tax=Sphingobacterium siyangense TaxID=459529 RepID=UPI003DA67F10